MWQNGKKREKWSNAISEKEFWNLVISKPEDHNLLRKTAIKIQRFFSKKRKHFSFANTKLQNHKIQEKVFNKLSFV